MNNITAIEDIFEVINVIFWAASYYILIYDIIKTNTGDGFSIDYQLLAISSSIYYAVYSISIVFNGEQTFITITDAIFAFHGVIAGIMVLIVTFVYPRNINKLDISVLAILMIGLSMILLYYLIGIYGGYAPLNDLWLFIGISKVIITTVKYTYQVLLNYDRKSTYGFAIGNIYLDFFGSLASVIQLSIEFYLIENYVINIAKVLLTSVSIVMDIVLFFQHYILYSKPKHNRVSLTQKFIE